MFLPIHQHEARLLVRALASHATAVSRAPAVHPADEGAGITFLQCLLSVCEQHEHREERVLEVRARLELDLGTLHNGRG